MHIILKYVLLIKLLLYQNIITLNEAKCGKPGQSWDGNNLIEMKPDKNQYSEFENVSYSCSGRLYVNDQKRSERIVKGIKSITKKYFRFCGPDGQWNGAVPKCVNDVLKKTIIERIQVYDSSNHSNIKQVFDLNLKSNNKPKYNQMSINFVEKVFSSYPRSVSKNFKRQQPLKCLTSGLKSKQKWKFYLKRSGERVMMYDLLVRYDSRFLSNSTFPVIITISRDEFSEPSRYCRLYDIQEKSLWTKNNYTIETFIHKFIQQNNLNHKIRYFGNFTVNYLLELQFICEIKSEFLLEKGSLEDPYLSSKAKEIPGVISIEFDSNHFDNQITICSHEFYQFSRRCGAPERHLQTSIEYKKSRNNLIDYSVIISCENGYLNENISLSYDKIEVRCGIDGDWIERFPKCLPNNSFLSNETKKISTFSEAENNDFLLAVIALLSSILIIGLIFVAICFYRIKKIKDSRLKTSNSLFKPLGESNNCGDKLYTSAQSIYDEFHFENYDEIRYNHVSGIYSNFKNQYNHSCNEQQYDDIQYKLSDEYMVMKSTINDRNSYRIDVQENVYN